MRKTTIFFTLTVLGLIVATFLSWKHLQNASTEKTNLRLSLDNAVESLDPAKAYSDDSLFVSAQVLEPLYQYHYLKRPYEIQPLLAEALPQFSEKGKVVKINLKKGVYYHPHPVFKGQLRELKAEDFVNQVKRLALEELKSPGQSILKGLLVGFDEYNNLIGGDWSKIHSTPLKGIQSVGDYTLEFHLTKSEPNIAYYLALNFIVPLPWELISFYKNKMDQVLIGTGPYMYKGFKDQYYDMEKFPEYRKDFYPTAGDRYANVQKLLDSSKEKIPFIDHIQLYVTQENERWNKFFNREIDLLTVPKTMISKLYNSNGELNSEIKSRGAQLKHFPILANRWLAFNMKDPLLGKNQHLRRAIAYSIDFAKYIQVISQNTNLRANSILVPGISGYLPAKDFKFKYDLVLAKEYLKMAGFTNPQEMPVITYSTRGNLEINLVEAQFIKEQLEAIGLRVEIELLNFSDFLKKGRAGELQFFTDVWLFDYPDGENILQLLVSHNSPGINKSAYSNPLMDELYLQLKETTNIDQRDKIIQRMEEIVFEDVPWIPMMYESSFVLQYPEIKNFRKSSIIRNYVKYLKIEN